MKLWIVNASVVVVGQDYAPSLFTQDFLRKNRIAKKGWELADQPIMTLTNSISRYSNGIMLAIDPLRIQIIDGNPQPDLGKSEIGGIAVKFLDHLPYARHTAVGVNITGFIDYEDAANVLRQEFIKDGAWMTDELRDVSVTFAYPKGETTVNLSYSVGIALLAGETEQRHGIGITANYHTQIDQNLSLEATAKEAKRQIGRINEHYEDFRTRIGQVFELEGSDHDGNQ